MRRFILAAGVAALAIAAPAAADKGGNGNKGGGGQAAAKADRGGGGKAAKVENRGGGGHKASHAGRGGNEFRFVGARAKGGDDGFKAARKQAEARDKFVNRELKQRDKAVAKFAKQDLKRLEKAAKQDVKLQRQLARNDLGRNDWDEDDRWVEGFARGVNGCPPGLANKNPLCMPPGQYKKIPGSALPAAYSSSLVPEFLRDIYRDDDDYYYRFNENGLVYRVDRDTNLIASLIPLFGGGLLPGQSFPSMFSDYLVPSQYQSFYPDNEDDYYRYANGYVYEIDRDNGLIEDIIPLYDQGYGVGQMLPSSYSYYNLPYPYRSAYADNDDYYYRYAPGAIYQVDRDSSLITSVVSLLTGTNLGVGQQLPMGYDAYNVPYAYRDQYSDTPDAWYRYANGNIYQVDPTTRLITAVIDAIV